MTERSGGVGLLGLLFLLFLGLKLGGIIQWSYWWITCPLWAPFALIGACLVVGSILIGIGAIFNIGNGKK